MVEENFREVPGLREKWEAENMMGRLAEPHEFKGACLYLLSNASSFMASIPSRSSTPLPLFLS